MVFLVAERVLHDTAPLHTCQGMFHMDTDTRQAAIHALLILGQLPSPRLFLFAWYVLLTGGS
jgi:hypothetical protein